MAAAAVDGNSAAGDGAVETVDIRAVSAADAMAPAGGAVLGPRPTPLLPSGVAPCTVLTTLSGWAPVTCLVLPAAGGAHPHPPAAAAAAARLGFSGWAAAGKWGTPAAAAAAVSAAAVRPVTAIYAAEAVEAAASVTRPGGGGGRTGRHVGGRDGRLSGA